MGELVRIRRALLSVSDKSGLVELAQALAGHGVELVSTGGTARALSEAGLKVRDVAELTGSPEMMDGRVKTLHPAVHGGLLARRDYSAHLQALADHDIAPIDLLVVNLYPFEATLAAGASRDEIIENIDIGGPAMLRSAAKNHADVTVITDLADYSALLDELATHDGATSLSFRRQMAGITYGRTAAYDAAIAGYFARDHAEAPRRLIVAGEAATPLRYGENPHQAATLYARPLDGGPSPANAEQVQGKALSYNNLNDAEAAFALVSELAHQGEAAAVIVKHANPCGAAVGDTGLSAYQRAFEADRESAFGGIVALSQPLDEATAQAVTEIFTEVVIAPAADAAARAVFAKKPNLRLLLSGALAEPSDAGVDLKLIGGGMLVQQADRAMQDEAEWQVVTERAPSEAEMTDMRLAWSLVKAVKSNAITIAKDGQSLGIGAGQMSRVGSARLAVAQAGARAQGAAMASDAFFPFADGLETAIAAGVTAVIQPGGAMRDAEVIEAANRAGLTMLMTGRRHFRH